jgi:hypothetical protein
MEHGQTNLAVPPSDYRNFSSKPIRQERDAAAKLISEAQSHTGGGSHQIVLEVLPGGAL